jgi:hypothetical protein
MIDMHITSHPATGRVIDRPPVLSALAVLGLNYAHIGRLAGVATMTVSNWATGNRPLPLVRHLALQFLVARLTGLVGAKEPPNTNYARRSQITVEAATRWAALARDELNEQTGGVYSGEDIGRGYELGRRMLARLEAAS